MAAPMALCRQLLSLARASRALDACVGHYKFNAIRSRLPLSSSLHTTAVLASTTSPITVTEEPDTLFQKVSVLVKCSDHAVLDSYEFFATMAAKELGITISKVFKPPRDTERFSLLKSVHIFRKHLVQYEIRTHYRCIELSHLTGSTTRVFLEYIQRNLPEGVAMEVTKIAMEKIPDHILEPMWKDQPTDDKSSQ
ncbi:small ribosomal subunit protein uS10m isoform 2-T2 [Aulostomus maculatus]